MGWIMWPLVAVVVVLYLVDPPGSEHMWWRDTAAGFAFVVSGVVMLWALPY